MRLSAERDGAGGRSRFQASVLKTQLYLQTNRAEPARACSSHSISGPNRSSRKRLPRRRILAKARLPVAARAVRQEMYENCSAGSFGECSFRGFGGSSYRAAALQGCGCPGSVRHSGIANEGHRLAQLWRKYRLTKLDAASPVTLGDKAKRGLARSAQDQSVCGRPTATGRSAWQAGSGGKPGDFEVGARIAGQHLDPAGGSCADCWKKTGAQGLNLRRRNCALSLHWKPGENTETDDSRASAASNAGRLLFSDLRFRNFGRACRPGKRAEALYLNRPGGQRLGWLTAVRRFGPRLRPGKVAQGCW